MYSIIQSNNKKQNKMFSARNKSASTGSMKKKQCVVSVDEYQQQQEQKSRGRNKNGSKNKKDFYVSVVSDEKELDQMMKTQKQKEKEDLQVWKRGRDTEKRTQRILLLQSRRVKNVNKMSSVKVFDEYEEHEGTGVLKHSCHYKDNRDDCEDCFYGSMPIYSI